MRFAMLFGLLLLSPCGGAGTPPNAGAQPRSPSVTPAADAATTSHEGAPPIAPRDVPPPSLVVDTRPLVTPITTTMVESMRAIIARGPETRADVFSKMGGSSVVNRGFLHCFADEPQVDFRGRDFGATLDYFKQARVGRSTSFDRTSLAAEVGWSLRQALSGRQSAVMEEVRASGARYALAFFGSNDVEGKNAHQFVTRLDRLVTTLSALGVVPVLGATYPRRANDREMNEQVRRYNRMSFAVASVYGLPYADFHQAMMPLPGRGLAADGYHPNSYIVGPRSRACDFGDDGMRFGNNHRNLMTMTVLDGLRRTLVAGEPAVVAPATARGAGTRAEPARILRLPFARRFALEELPEASTDADVACARATGEGRAFTIRLRLDRAMRLRISAVAMGPVETYLGVRRAGAECVGDGDHEQVVAFEAGDHELVVFARASRRVAEDQLSALPRALVVIDEEPTAGP